MCDVIFSVESLRSCQNILVHLGLPILDQGTVYGLEFFPHRKEGEKALAGSAHLSSLGNLEGEKPYSF